MQFGSLIIYKKYDWWNVKQAKTKQKTEEQSDKANRFKGEEVKIQIPEEQAKKMPVHCKYWQQTRAQDTGVTIRAGGERRKTGSIK